MSLEPSLPELLRFLKLSFGGGTDAASALSHALDRMEQEALKRADLLMISDFIMADLSDPLGDRIRAQRTAGNRFHSLVIGNLQMRDVMRGTFDREWIFDPANSSVSELLTFHDSVLGAHA